MRTTTSYSGFSRAVLLLLIFSFLAYPSLHGQNLRGRILDAQNGDPLVGARVMLANTTIGGITDINGNFSFRIGDVCPCDVIASYLGFDSLVVKVKDPSKRLNLRMYPSGLDMEEVEITAQTGSKLQEELSLTVESLSLEAIENTSEASFYDALANLREVDLLTVSFGFKVINTRGFNSSAPVRSLQLIDGIDNAAPGLNYPVGNFLGLGELDVEGVDLVIGASSAYFGPGAFNGVLNMRTKSPFLHKGLDIVVKGGERDFREGIFRYANTLPSKRKSPRWAYKVNGSYTLIRDWEATNYDPASGSRNDSIDETNLGGYDAVNIYGDETSGNFTERFDQFRYPGLGRFYRVGYREEDLVDYDSYNLKVAGALHFKPTDNMEMILSTNYGRGSTVMQLDNRLKLNDVWLIQNKFEIKEDGKFFLRAYQTEENSGNTFDIVTTAYLLQSRIKGNGSWIQDYRNHWDANYVSRVQNLENFPTIGPPPTFAYDFDLAQQIIAQNGDSVSAWHQRTSNAVNGGFLVPGTPEYEEVFNDITLTPISEGGTKYVDESKLYHVHGEYKFEPGFVDEVTVGGNFRRYLPYSEGTIFSDTSGTVIRTWEAGMYVGAEKRVLDERLKINAAVRFDKNKNYNLLISPAASMEWQFASNQSMRLLLSSALRNPTLIEQFFYFRVGSAYLLGNINGYENLVTLESFDEYRNAAIPDSSIWERFDAPPLVPEQNLTGEYGYQGIFDRGRLAVNATYYLSRYKNFIGYRIGLEVPRQNIVLSPQVYRISANAQDIVTTTGASVALSYQFNPVLGVKTNYSWNKIITDSEDPLIPAYNTPEHKVNTGISLNNLSLLGSRGWNAGANFRWVASYTFESSPQFSGKIPAQYFLNAQIGKNLPKLNSSVKLAGSNLINRQQNGLYGAPAVGRFIFLAWRFSIR